MFSSFFKDLVNFTQNAPARFQPSPFVRFGRSKRSFVLTQREKKNFL